jgi:hypothetical protein
VAAHEAAAAAPGRLLDAAAAKWRGIEDSDGEDDGPAAAPPSGVRLGGSTPPLVAAVGAAGARVAAGAAALQRMEGLEARWREELRALQRERERGLRQLGDAAAGERPGAAGSAPSPSQASPGGGTAGAAGSRPGTSGSGGGGGGSSGSEGEAELEAELEEGERAAQDAGHFDPATEAKEREMERLGSVDEAGVGGGGGCSGEVALTGSGPASSPPEGGAASRHGAEAPASQPPEAVGEAMDVDGPTPAAQGARPGGDGQVEPAGASAAHPAASPPPSPPPLRLPAAPTGAAADPAAPGLDALDSPAARKVAQARAALQRLHLEVAAATGPAAASGGEAPEAALAATLEALSRALGNLVASPGEPRFQALRLGNAAVARRIGRWRAARELLQLAGFEEGEAPGGGGGGGGAALVWRRRDPGLAWLVASVVSDAAAAAAT